MRDTKTTTPKAQNSPKRRNDKKRRLIEKCRATGTECERRKEREDDQKKNERQIVVASGAKSVRISLFIAIVFELRVRMSVSECGCGGYRDKGVF